MYNNFNEVERGLTKEQAIEHASACLQCKHRPCVAHCPVGTDIPTFLSHVAEGQFPQAYEALKKQNLLPCICGRVCPQETQCEGACVRGIKGKSIPIGSIERFLGDMFLDQPDNQSIPVEKNGIKMAVVGSGPAGLTCAGELARMGYQVTLFEAFHVAGGVLTYGIPEFRLPKAIVEKEVSKLKDMGVDIVTNMVIGKVHTLDELLEEYQAVFIGSGAGVPRFMGIKGEGLRGVYSANEYLTRINLMKAHLEQYDTPLYHGKHVVVLGGGNVAMDAARCAVRLGAHTVRVIYRRSRSQMPARRAEVDHAEQEGVLFEFLSNPREILGETHVNGIMCQRMQLGEPDQSGRRSPVSIPDSNYRLEADCVIVAIGQSPNHLINSGQLKTNRNGGLVTDENGFTGVNGVYAGGDAVTGAATVILAMEMGKKAAAAMSRDAISKMNEKPQQ